MEKNQNQYEQVLNRILIKSPCSVVLPQDIDSASFTASFLEDYGEPLGKGKIMPVRIKCGEFPDAVSLWKEFAMKIKEAMPAVYGGDIITTRCFMAIEGASTTDVIKSYLIRIFSLIEGKSDCMFLLVMEDFENVIEKMAEFDIRKVRGMRTYAVILSITPTGLRKLCDDKYGHEYFCNQFVTFRI